MPDQARKEKQTVENSPTAVDAIRHVGPTLEAESLFVPTGELPENRIENEAIPRTANGREPAADEADEYDREAEAMGAEPLRTRLPGDTSSHPHTDATPQDPSASRHGSRRKHAA